MAYIPDDAKWYLAEIIEECLIEGESTGDVHINFVLVRADSPEDAYQNALTLGQDAEVEYHNIYGQQVEWVFRGLRNLHVIHDELGHGAEIIWERRDGLSKQAIKKLISSKEQLNIFRPNEVD